ncbi:hypothetical protein [Tenacibaculum xiamenense]|uniref:hypothetical protein n=1 Tax=Tenacibaculum xiamenense TaxID=1261553 RepID=UPI00389676D4
MDSLDKYKKAWNEQPEETRKVSKADIYKMSRSKSSSIVKWIFIIGILEFLLPFSTYLFWDFDEIYQGYEEFGMQNFVMYSQIVMYPIVLVFIFFFYKNYKNIKTTDSTSELMNKILKTRKTVKYYILTNLGYACVLFIVIIISAIQSHPEFKGMALVVFIVTLIIVCSLLIGVFWLIYQLLYGILLKKLNKNYKILKEIEK